MRSERQRHRGRVLSGTGGLRRAFQIVPLNTLNHTNEKQNEANEEDQCPVATAGHAEDAEKPRENDRGKASNASDEAAEREEEPHANPPFEESHEHVTVATTKRLPKKSHAEDRKVERNPRRAFPNSQSEAVRPRHRPDGQGRD